MLDTDDLNRRIGTDEALLRAEIGFWRDLIASCDSTQDPASVERMQQALALAESRLCDLLEWHRRVQASDGPRPSNVFHLDFSS